MSASAFMSSGVARNTGECSQVQVSLDVTSRPQRWLAEVAQRVLENVSTLEKYIGIDVEPQHVPTLVCQLDEVPRQAGCYADDARFRLLTSPSQELEAGLPEVIGGLMTVERCLGVLGSSDELGQRQGKSLNQRFIDVDGLAHRYPSAVST